MRYVLMLLGVALIGVGIAIGLGKLSYPDETSVVKVGGLSATLTRERPIPQWLGAVTALTGLAIGLLATKYKR